MNTNTREGSQIRYSHQTLFTTEEETEGTEFTSNVILHSNKQTIISDDLQSFK